MTRIAVIGPGAVGATVAAWLAQNPALDVTVCVRTAFDRLEVETPGGPLTATPRVLTSPDQAPLDEKEPVDWAIVTTKTYDAVATGA